MKSRADLIWKIASGPDLILKSRTRIRTKHPDPQLKLVRMVPDDFVAVGARMPVGGSGAPLRDPLQSGYFYQMVAH